MKKLLLSLVILCMGLVASVRLHQQAALERSLVSQCQAGCEQITNRIAELTGTAAILRAQIKEQRSRLNALAAAPAPDAELLEFLSASQPFGGRSAASAELRQRLGIVWNSSPDYILVSKSALKNIWFPGVDANGVVSPTLCDILALTPQERAAIEAALQRAGAEHAAWFKTAVEREASSGEILAEYRVPANPELEQRLNQEAKAALLGILGEQRLELAHEFALVWSSTHGELGALGIRFTVHHTPDRQPPLWFQLEEMGGSSAAGNVQPGSFPDLFRGVFPGGWSELAQREGFALPSDFPPLAPAEQLPQP